jgi:putative Mn2+ efflux pump MntP
MDVMSEEDKRHAHKQLLIGIPVGMVTVIAGVIGISTWLGDNAAWVAFWSLLICIGAYFLGREHGINAASKKKRPDSP